MEPTTRAGWGARRWIILLAVIAAVWIGARLRHPHVPGGTTGTSPANDCQQDGLKIVTETDTVTGADLRLIGPIADLPEYHDCQRFVVQATNRMVEEKLLASRPTRDTLAYGPLVAIWAANKLGERLSLAPVTPVPPSPADTLVAGGNGGTSGTRAPSIMATPIAVIYDFDSKAGYDPLGINPGFSCLYVWKANEWQARMVSLGPKAPDPADGAQCFDPVDIKSATITGARQLEVVPASPVADLGPADIPPVARWDWDVKNKLQYIGIRCGSEWCSIGPAHFSPLATEPSTVQAVQAYHKALEPMPSGLPQASPAKVSRVVAVRGWYDQQRLDLRTPLAGGTLQLTDIVGTAFPHPGLESLALDDFRNKWIPTGYVYVTDAYKGKVPLEAGMNRIYLCRGTRTECPGVPAATAECFAPGQATDDPWWGKVVPESGSAYYRCVPRRDHKGMAIPAAAARWNWSEKDAKTWWPCGTSCCIVN
jgi:hypothetical protein